MGSRSLSELKGLPGADLTMKNVMVAKNHNVRGRVINFFAKI
jgi:hypothetical protein